jgi:putative phosphoribosyl transferase
MFANRRSAGPQLAAWLQQLREEKPVVLALPRGGVPVGFEIAEGLDAPLDIVLVRKIGVPSRRSSSLLTPRWREPNSNSRPHVAGCRKIELLF